MKFLKNTCIILSIITLASCSDSDEGPVAEVKMKSDPIANPIGVNEANLFAGKTLAGWHDFNKTGKVENWAIEDSAMVCLGAARDAAGGDMVSDIEYENFDLSWQWKVTKGGNSGVMYHVVESPKYIAPYETGSEYQMIDDIGFPEKVEDWQKSGVDYAMNVPNSSKKLLPVGEWNSSRIVFNKGKVEHWLNGEAVVYFEAWSDEWNKKKAKGKWKDYPDYGKAKKGRTAFRIIVIKCILKISGLKNCHSTNRKWYV